MKAKAQALDEMIDTGILTDYTSNKDDIEGELEKIAVKSSVDEELAKLKIEHAKKRRQTTLAVEQPQEIEDDKVREKGEQEKEEVTLAGLPFLSSQCEGDKSNSNHI